MQIGKSKVDIAAAVGQFSCMGAPAIPQNFPKALLGELTSRAVHGSGDMEPETFPYLASRGEWVVDDEDDRARILAADPNAKFFAVTRQVERQYQERFGNIDEISHPEIVFDPGFIALLAHALETGKAVKPKTVKKAFPGIGWEV